MRILAFCDYFSEDSSGGSERASWEIYRRLGEQGAAIRVITALPARFQAFPSTRNLEVRAVPMLDLERTIGLQASLSPLLFLKLRALVAGFRPDVLHANSLFFQTSIAAALLQRVSGTPLVTTAHIGALDFLPGPTRIIAGVYERIVGGLILARSTRVIAVSESVRQHLLTLGVAPTRITVIPNGVDLEQFHLPPPLAREGGVGTVAPRIIFVGRLIPNKGPHLLLDALLALHREGLRFTAVYLGDGPMRLELLRRAASLGASIEFRGHVRDVAAELRNADLLVRPSLTEGLPLALLEAMASGVCVIASDIAGNRDLIDDGANGVLVAPSDVGALRDAIRTAIQAPELRRRLATAGLATAQRYSWDRAAAGVSTVLTEAAGRQRSRVAA
jgi:glycosyltransferase involved in cell wall biosynthesis